MTTEAKPQTQLTRQHQTIVPFEPTNISEAIQLCDMLAKSALVPDALRGKPADIMLILMTGRDLGLSVTQSFRALFVVKGRPSLSSAYKVARAQQHPDCEYFRLVSSSATVAKWETKRRGQPAPVVMEWTIEQAKRAGLGGDNWNKYPEAMLRARGGSALADAVYSDAIYGLPTAEELDADTASPLPADIVAPPPAGQQPVDAEFTVAAEPEPTIEERITQAQGWISQATTKAELQTVGALVSKEPQGVKDAVRGAFAAKTAELK